jgi:hypothetical protein
MALIPSGVHWGTLLVGILLGWFLVPMVLGLLHKGTATKSA